MQRTTEGTLGNTLPKFTVGTFEYRGVVFLRAGDIVDWLDAIAETVDGHEDVTDASKVVADIRAMIADVGTIRG